MSKAVTLVETKDLSAKIEAVLMKGDLSGLSDQERVAYHNKVCESVGLNPLTAPFAYIKLNGKLVLYAKRDATDQLRKVHNISITITARDNFEGLYVVTAKARDASGREDESTGAVNLKGLSGDNLANALMKAETKAKRRVTLSICGLGLLDETEAEPLRDKDESSEEKEVNPHSAKTKELANEIMAKAETGHKPDTKPLKNYAPQKNPLKEPVDLGEYVVPFGVYGGQKLKDIDADDLANYVAQIIEANAKGKRLPKGGPELLRTAEEYINSLVDQKTGPNFNYEEDFDDA